MPHLTEDQSPNRTRESGGAPPQHGATHGTRKNLADWITEWDTSFAGEARRAVGAGQADALVRRWIGAIPLSYRETFSATEALQDCLAIEAGSGAAGAQILRFYNLEADAGRQRLKILGPSELSLEEIVPPFRDLGITIRDERPYRIAPADQRPAWIYDLGIDGVGDETIAEEIHARIEETIRAVWSGTTESDAFHGLITAAGLTYRDALLLRAYFRYLRQSGLGFSLERVAQVLGGHGHIAARLVSYFDARFRPGLDPTGSAAQSQLTGILETLDDITARDDDRIIRSYLDAMKATVRTNFYQAGANGASKGYVSLKIASAELPLLPEPRPESEIWVYAATVEGIHLRFGSIARGGLRWSDRREDFRTEALDLVKAQVVKNAVIVPTGAKGCFYVKGGAGTDRSGSGAREAYKSFINGLLDLTDNIVPADNGTTVQPPANVVRHDAEDTYLVVAADKGTARFSDLANEVAAEHGYWLKDAFASGGTVGYNHKAMGITARGAWKSVERHLMEADFPWNSAPIDTIGIGDMSGDVFGNGMLYTDKIALKAAFDHRHIFLDPTPDPAVSHQERARLFRLEGSSWDDYDRNKLSGGGGIFSRQAKLLLISPEAAYALRYEGPVTLTPEELIRAILRAPATLLFNGGVGTYVKHSLESHSDVLDKANDAVRIDANQLRAQIIGEGGNLGVTPRGRVEASLSGVRINTDAVDNSAGVDCSDHEVNIKILLNLAVSAGDIAETDRPGLLRAMTDEVAQSVLANNYEQNFALGTTVGHTRSMTQVYLRAMKFMESKGRLHRRLDSMPSVEEILRRLDMGQSLTRPEICVLLAYMKSSLSQEILASSIPDEAWAQQELEEYFPKQLLHKARRHLQSHPLKREIIATSLANRILNHSGITFVFRLCEETGASEADAVRAYFISAGIWNQPAFFSYIRGLDGKVPATVQERMDRIMRRLLDRSSRWFLKHQTGTWDVLAEIEKYRRPGEELSAQLDTLLRPIQLQGIRDSAAELEAQGVPAEFAVRSATLLYKYPLLDIAEAASTADIAPSLLATTYFDLFEQIEGSSLLSRIDSLARNDPWETMARAALREDFYDVLSSASVALATPKAGSSRQVSSAVIESRLGLIADALSELSARETSNNRDFEILTIVLRALRSLRTAAFTPR
ncbi:NAD-glutamate dehydrogenase domain-containing protein [Arthrobacter sp. S2(2024)]|uniref:NAD-glutamate dehydrogenase domain-containing protein n=1 Tax=Arthrobacter sp. S2(2024) TaxID=3111911 RepID=UPI002FC766C2